MANKRGGARPGAGRKAGTGKYGTSTVVMRVPETEKAAVQNFLLARAQKTQDRVLPIDVMLLEPAPIGPTVTFFPKGIQAGFPSPADEQIKAGLDFNELLVKNPPATFGMKVKDNSMTGAGIFDGDIIVVDRSIEARDGSVVVAEYEGSYTVKRLYKRMGEVQLLSENQEFPAIEFKKGQEMVVFGVVTNVIHPIK